MFFLSHLSSYLFMHRFAVRYFRSHKLTSPSADRNCLPIAEALDGQLNRNISNLFLLEIASGTGQHAGYLAPLFPNIKFQTSEIDQSFMNSLKAYKTDCPTKNICEPILVDITIHPKDWNTQFEPNSVDYMLNINMLHISPFNTAIGLFLAAGYLLKAGGMLFTYGPYAINGELTPQSNVSFNESLRQRNSQWGVRDIVDLERLAKANGMKMTQILDMPSNNKTITWTKL